MRTRNRQRPSDQLRLFAPSAPLQWKELPPEARARTVALLARLLRQHVRVRDTAEVHDE
jgi:hypothetical protein